MLLKSLFNTPAVSLDRRHRRSSSVVMRCSTSSHRRSLSGPLH